MFRNWSKRGNHTTFVSTCAQCLRFAKPLWLICKTLMLFRLKLKALHPTYFRVKTENIQLTFLKIFCWVFFATTLVGLCLNTKTETPAPDPRRNAGKRDKPLTLGGYWGRRRVMQCAFSICSRGQFEVVYSLEVVCILYNSCVYCLHNSFS